MLQCWRRTGGLTIQESPPPGICHPRQKKMLMPGGQPGGGGRWAQVELTDALARERQDILKSQPMFTYSHANTPLGQSERAYYLSYFIKINKRKYFKKSFIVAVFIVLPAKTNILIDSSAVPLSSTINAGFGLFFCAQSETSIRLSRGTGSLRVGY